jgi:hypothetical protein
MPTYLCYAIPLTRPGASTLPVVAYRVRSDVMRQEELDRATWAIEPRDIEAPNARAARKLYRDQNPHALFRVDILRNLWELDTVQFPRLLAEIRAVGLTDEQYADLNESMDLDRDSIDALLERAEQAWIRVKDHFMPSRLGSYTGCSVG